jgi:hypothetical protein
MKLIADAKRRVVLPSPIKKGDLLLMERRAKNQWLLTRIERRNRTRIEKLKSKSVADVLRRSAGANCEFSEIKGEPVDRLSPG